MCTLGKDLVLRDCGVGGGVVVVVEIKELEDVSSFSQMQLVCALVPIQKKRQTHVTYITCFGVVYW